MNRKVMTIALAAVAALFQLASSSAGRTAATLLAHYLKLTLPPGPVSLVEIGLRGRP